MKQWIVAVVVVAFTTVGAARGHFGPARHAVPDVRRQLEAGDVVWEYLRPSGYLLALLDALRIPLESQVAVFSPTSAQGRLVSPENPRVIYFSDQAAVSWVRGSTSLEVIDFSDADGLEFYTVVQDQTAAPRLDHSSECGTCHRSERTLGVPGLLVLSTPDAYGGGANSHGMTTDHRTPFRERWGGWYVTGLSSGWRHRGNRVGQGWLESLRDQFDLTGYPTVYSDMVALMVLEHQTRALNLITVLADRAHRFDARTEPVRQVVAELVDYLLFVDEAPVPARVIGTSGFAQYFQESGVRDRRGRSLWDLDLKRRLFRYPCSYLLYSPAFNSLPATIKNVVYDRMGEVLTAKDLSEKSTILEILSETNADFRQYVSGRTAYATSRWADTLPLTPPLR